LEEKSEQIALDFEPLCVSPDMSGITRHFDFGKELVRRGHQVTIFASGFDHRQKSTLKLVPKRGEGLKNTTALGSYG